MKHLATLVIAAAMPPLLSAQANQVPGRDATLRVVDTLQVYGRDGVFPNGRNGFACGVTICNVGVGGISWVAPMDPNHPVYAPMMFRVVDGRIEQVSGASYVKHAFASTNGSLCATCTTTNTSVLGPNCSDTYGSGLNADRYYLGPPTEIDPWLGVWTPLGSMFDRGDPDVGPPINFDGQRSLTRLMANNLPPVAHRIEVDDAALNVPGARYFYGMYVVVAGEPATAREDNWCYREFRPTWNGVGWTATDLSAPRNGSPLSFWPDARVSSGGNAPNDGLFYVGVKVTGPDTRGLWHYEYAVLNRDNSRGGASFRIPVCSSAHVLNLRFRDIDGNALNDWTAQVQNGEIAFMAPASGNLLEWNTLYNVSFDIDAGPVAGNVSIDQGRPGPGGMTVTVATEVPGIGFTEYLGDGCGNPAPAMYPTGTPPFAVIPNPSFGLRIEDTAPNASLALFAAIFPGNTAVGPCHLYLDVPSSFVLGSLTATAQGTATFALGVPNNVALEGSSLTFQVAELVPGGPLFGALELSNGLRVRIGNQTTGCP